MRNTYKKPKPFFMVYAEGKDTPACKHETLESAEMEADRLSNKLGVSCYVLQATEEYEPMVEPKFKVGDKIKNKNLQIVHKVADIKNGFYYNDCGSMFLNIANQDLWELAPIEIKKHKPKRPCWFQWRKDKAEENAALFFELNEECGDWERPLELAEWLYDGDIVYVYNGRIEKIAPMTQVAMMLRMFGTELRIKEE